MKLKHKRLLRRLLGNPSMLEQDAASGAVLSMDPPIVLTTFSYPDATTQLRALASRLGRRRSIMVIVMSWIFEPGALAAQIIDELRGFRAAYPWMDVVLTCSDPSEVDVLASLGEPSELVSLSAYVSEQYFHPLETVEVSFDAIYNARFSPEKRVELAQDIDSVAYITRQLGDELTSPVGKAILDLIAARHPRHEILNRRNEGKFRQMSAEEVNRAYNRASVGLCLSSKEGAMLSCMEYMLAGLPVVSVPNVGGRDLFYDPDYWIITEPDPTSIRVAVEELRDRRIPRDVIRARSLEKLALHRQRFIDLINQRLEAIGFPARYSGPWPWPHYRDFFQWRKVERHFADGRTEDARRAS